MKKLLMLAIALGVALTGAAQEHLYSLNKAGLSKEISPKQDFYHYVNQTWQEQNPLTPEYSRFGSFNVLRDSTNNRVQRIVTNLGKSNPEPGSVAYKIAALYETGMDSVKRNKLGATPVLADLQKIENTPASEMEDLFIWMHKYISSPFMGLGFQSDLHNSDAYAMYLGAAGLGLGDRDYYLEQDKDNKKIRDAYVKLIKEQMQNAGYSKKEADRIAKNVMKVETLLADSTWTREQSRDLRAMDNLLAWDDVVAMYPNLPLERIFREVMGIEPTPTLYVTEINTVKQGDNLMKNLTDREKKDFYLWETVAMAAPYLSDKFSNSAFEFTKVKSGIQQQRPRWKRVLAATEDIMGEGIGELYVQEFFPESSKIYMEGLVENLRNALGKHIINLEWMSDDTKLQAIKKLNGISVKIGYPDKWQDYSELNVSPDLSYYENMKNARLWEFQDYLKKWGKPVDKSEWHMTPQTVNAYYNPMVNEIVFPAAILQAPFYDPNSSDAENYGGIGMVIGHELTHGFDDMGRIFDSLGNMTDWWTAEDEEAFNALATKLAAQYDAVEVLPGLNANGLYTLGENIADQGGLRISLTAFLDAQKKKGVDITSEEALIDGLPPMQVFYMNFANLWAENIRPEEIRSMTISDTHSLGINRVNVALRNITPFFETFGITEGDAMYRPAEEMVIIW